jgi:hypothetical protein
MRPQGENERFSASALRAARKPRPVQGIGVKRSVTPERFKIPTMTRILKRAGLVGSISPDLTPLAQRRALRAPSSVPGGVLRCQGVSVTSKRLSGRYGYVGPPGCGKTTKLSKMVRAVVEDLGESTSGERSPVVIASLTKTAANEIAGRGLPIPPEAVGTLHAHCYRTLGRPKIVTPKDLVDFNEKNHAWALGDAARDTLDEAQIFDPYGGGTSAGDAAFGEYLMSRARMTPRDEWDPTVLDFADAWEEWKTSIERYDFTDLIESVLTQRLPHPMSPEVVFADESQDFSAMEFALVRMWGDHAGALVVAGDPYQSLYSWRGAQPDELMSGRLEEGRRHVLSQSYRVPAKVRALAMRVIEPLTRDDPSYEYSARLDESGSPVQGETLSVGGTWRQPEETVSSVLDVLAESTTSTVMIAATCGHMLRPAVSVLKSRAVPFWNPWRPSDGSWNPLHTSGTRMVSRIESLTRPMTEPGEDDGAQLPGLEASRLWWSWDDVAKIAPMLTARGVIRHGKKTAIPDLAKEGGAERRARYELETVFETGFLDAIESAFDSGRIGEVYAVVTPLVVARFRRTYEYAAAMIETRGLEALRRPRLAVGTVHSFKGAEADDVFLFPDLANKAAESWLEGSGEGWASVLRTFYVGVTRARRRVWVARACGHALPISRMINEEQQP